MMKRILMTILVVLTATSALGMTRLRWTGQPGWIIESGISTSQMDASIDLWGARALPAKALYASGVPLRYIRYTVTNNVCFASEMTQAQKDARDLPLKYREWDVPTQLWVEKSQQDKDAADAAEAAAEFAQWMLESNIESNYLDRAIVLTLTPRIEVALKGMRVLVANNSSISNWFVAAGITADSVKAMTSADYKDEIITKYTNYLYQAQQP